MPTLYLPHGGGPWPFVDVGPIVSPEDVVILKDWLSAVPRMLPERPKAILIISAHWEEPVPTLMTAAHPPMLYDYRGFPPEAFEIKWPAPGDPAMAERVAALLEKAGFPTARDPQRGFDHGTFVPLKVAWPEADIPTVQLSLKQGLNPAEHLAMGRALAPLRDEGVFILGSGMSYHNLRVLRNPGEGLPVSETFDAWMQKSSLAAPEARAQALSDWESAPGARLAHPREEHLLPLMVIAGAAGTDIGSVPFSRVWMGVRVSAIRYG